MLKETQDPALLLSANRDLVNELTEAKAEIERLRAENKAAWDSAEYNARRAESTETDADRDEWKRRAERMYPYCAASFPEAKEWFK